MCKKQFDDADSTGTCLDCQKKPAKETESKSKDKKPELLSKRSLSPVVNKIPSSPFPGNKRQMKSEKKKASKSTTASVHTPITRNMTSQVVTVDTEDN